MAEFNYVALNAEGTEEKGTIVADNRDMALAHLREQELFPVKVDEASFATKDLDIQIGDAVSPRDLSVFCRQLNSMLSSGVTILASLGMLSEQTENKYLAKSLKEVEENIMRGETLATSMRAHPKAFPDFMVNMVAAGEASGKLELIFVRLAEFYERSAKTKAMIKKASIYPIIVCIVAVIVTAIMLIKVVPSYTAMFNDLGVELPWITKAVVAASDFLVAYWYFVLGGIIAIVIAMKAWHSTPDGKMAKGRVQIKLPVFGNLNVKTACSLFSRTLGTLIFSGLGLQEALVITANTMQNEVFKRSLLQTSEDVKQGIPLSVSLKRSELYPPMVDYMVAIGEETGELEDMLNKCADYYDEEVDMATQSMMAALEPMIILLLAGVVGVIIAACLAPMVRMYQSLGNL